MPFNSSCLQRGREIILSLKTSLSPLSPRHCPAAASSTGSLVRVVRQQQRLHALPTCPLTSQDLSPILIVFLAVGMLQTRHLGGCLVGLMAMMIILFLAGASAVLRPGWSLLQWSLLWCSMRSRYENATSPGVPKKMRAQILLFSCCGSQALTS